MNEEGFQTAVAKAFSQELEMFFMSECLRVAMAAHDGEKKCRNQRTKKLF